MTTKFERFWSICDHDNIIAEKVIETIRHDFPQYVEDIDEAILKNQPDVLFSCFHKVKGSISYLGYKKEADALYSLEKMSKESISPQLKTKYRPLRKFILNLPDILAQEVNNTRQQ
ncbi:Hpt domain-containing protein [Colwelliaceae bacterium 6441]